VEIYLPIAEMSVNVLLLLTLGGAVGLLSGMFGVGGGFLLTPLLIFMGIPPAVAVSSQTNQVVASSVSGALAYWRRRAIDLRMGWLLLGGGIAGSALGVQLFALLRARGQIDIVIAISYVLFLTAIGALMLAESVHAARRARSGARRRARRPRTWIHRLPVRMRFPASGIYISAIPPVGIGALVGVMAAVMGVGGGFIMVPAMIYLLRMPSSVVVGTSLFQIIFVTAFTTVFHAVQNQTVDIVLALLLIGGSAIGAQIGVRLAGRIRAEALRALLAALALAVGLKLGWDVTARPAEPFALITSAEATR
jgi:hypothetical protein